MSGYSTTTNAMAAFLNVEPATRTLDSVRFVFHFCNLVNLTLGAIAFGVGIGYDLIVINVEDDSHIRQIQTKFLVTGVFVVIHGLIGAYGCFSKQSRCLILYGMLGFCLLIVGPMAAWTAVIKRESIPRNARNTFYVSYLNYTKNVNIGKSENSGIDSDMPLPNDERDITNDDIFIWGIVSNKDCQMLDIPEDLSPDYANFSEQLDQYEGGFVTDRESIVNVTCLFYIRHLTKVRVVTMYVVLLLLSVTQSVCMICDILFIFWSLKEEADMQLHEIKEHRDNRVSTKLQLLSRFFPCCFKLPGSEFNKSFRTNDLFDISDHTEDDLDGSSPEVNV